MRSEGKDRRENKWGVEKGEMRLEGEERRENKWVVGKGEMRLMRLKEEETKEKGWRERDQEGSNEVGRGSKGRERMEVGRRKEENKEEWGFVEG